MITHVLSSACCKKGLFNPVLSITRFPFGESRITVRANLERKGEGAKVPITLAMLTKRCDGYNWADRTHREPSDHDGSIDAGPLTQGFQAALGRMHAG